MRKRALLATAVLAATVAVSFPSAADAAIYWSSPGCTTSGVCMYRGSGTPIGYDGAGTATVNQSNIRSVAAGTRTTTFRLATGTTYVVQAGKMLTFPNALQTVVSISR